MTTVRAPERRPRPIPSARRRPWYRRRWFRLVRFALILLLVWLAYSLFLAFTAPGTDSVSSRLAEWARDHHLGAVVNLSERISYDLHPPATGGSVSASSPLHHVVAQPTSAPSSGPVIPAYARLAPITPFASPPLPGEGKWQVLYRVGGIPVMQAAFLRPDAVHTSYTAVATWWDPKHVQAIYHPGFQEPGGSGYPVPSYLPASERTGLIAAFNSAFRLQDSRGGAYAYGRMVAPLVPGQATEVIYKDGSMNVGAWGRDVTMSSNVVAARQNLALIVDNGQPVAGLDSNAGNQWGATLGNALYVWRSGLGVTKTGQMIYVASNALTAQSLANLLVRAGAVRAMELDINPYWTSFILYSSSGDRNILPDMTHPASRYDTPSSRDFVALYLR